MLISIPLYGEVVFSFSHPESVEHHHAISNGFLPPSLNKETHVCLVDVMNAGLVLVSVFLLKWNILILAYFNI